MLELLVLVGIAAISIGGLTLVVVVAMTAGALALWRKI